MTSKKNGKDDDCQDGKKVLKNEQLARQQEKNEIW